MNEEELDTGFLEGITQQEIEAAEKAAKEDMKEEEDIKPKVNAKKSRRHH